MTSYRLNNEHNGIEILFDSKPSAETLNTLKNSGFRWHRGGGYWYAKHTEERIELAKKLTSGSAAESAEAAEIGPEFYTTTSAGYMGATEVTGSLYASGSRLYGAELSKAIRETLKRCGICGASVRCKTFSGGQEITVTLKASEGDIVSKSAYVEASKDDISGYWFTSPAGEQIHKDSMPWGNGAQEIINHTHALRYEHALKDMRNSWGLSVRGDEGLFTSAFVKKIKAVQRIMDAFNHDDSNGMVDYFDRHFYDEIRVRVA